MRRHYRWPSSDRAPRPFVAFAAVDRKHAMRLYRAQNLIWVWLGIAALLTCLAYFDRPHLGPVVVSQYPVLDITRALTFGLGGVLISAGIWAVRRVLEIWGHLSFATGAILTAVAEVTLHLDALSIGLTAGVAAASALRVWYIVAWIGAGKITTVVDGGTLSQRR